MDEAMELFQNSESKVSGDGRMGVTAVPRAAAVG